APEVSARVTRVLTGALEGVPAASVVRGASMPGMAQVSVVLGGGAEPSRAREDVRASVDRLRGLLPQDARVQIGPDSGGTGWVYQIALVDPGHRFPATALRRFADEMIVPSLSAVPGVVEVAPVGGTGERVMVDLSSAALRDRSLAFDGVLASVRRH